MKQILLVLLFVFGCASFNVQAKSHRINKHNYDYKMSTPQPDDLNNPTVMGVASLFVPGLGQMLSGEVGRAVCFFR